MTLHLVQEALLSTPRIGGEQFVFLLCQHGTEPTLKARWLGENSRFRLAFSRPGLLTLKFNEAEKVPPKGVISSESFAWPEPPKPEPPKSEEHRFSVPEDWMIRLSGLAIGQIRGDRAEAMVDEALALSGFDWDNLHVCQRDSDLPGLKGFEPGPNELCDEIGKIFADRFTAADKPIRLGGDAEFGQRVLDIVLIEPNHWLVGYHVVSQSHQRWPGGAYPVAPPSQMISRAYLKMAEAIAWSGLPIASGDWIVEIGSAPGGACQRLLDLGLRVTGIDPAEMDPLLLGNPRFEHWRGKSSTIRRKMYSKFRWLAADANVAPNYTLECVEDIVNYKTSRIQGLLLTLKLSTYDLAEKMGEYQQRVRDWGFERVEVRQLASNRRECCLVAERH